MAWIELHQAVFTHRKTFELAARLRLDDTYAAAHVIRLWTWALDNAPDGDLSHLSARAIAYGAGWRNESELFLAALIETGWVDERRTIHDWDEYAGRLVERRAANAARMRAARAHQAADDTNVNGTSGTRAGNRARTCGATVPDLTGPNRTGPHRTTTPQPPPAEGEPITPLTTDDEQLWERSRELLRADLSPANWQNLIDPLTPLGRGPDGGLRLSAPRGQGIGKRVVALVKRALLDEGDDAAKHTAILER